MKRIIIIGCPGNGKSRLAKILGEKLNLPVIHLDKLFWLPNWVERSKEEFNEILLDELEKEHWIMDGNFGASLPTRLKYCDHVILLNYPTAVCYFRVLKRVIKNRGKTRADMTEGCNERFDPSFMKYIRTFKRTKLPNLYKRLSEANVTVTEIKSDKELNKFLQSIETNKN